ncbi:type II toxin-antitoxin system HicB family antitoxin [Salmonella enterica]|nr:type II toxin-antitoxin system HicB family antitoxin [Salmonella enterica]EJJ3962406.1 type II toxin-antitoxin system HicB family antitoxin [Salmonella enterica]EJJ4071634.1 type II toxin-antitoxin system HicB family antitoxin [Salmonella enterica]EJJ4108949.1 type II toxin-antitoxin system HicB family antitoxin [Salmonella enterica]EJJ4154226.1 type II toxin-antitoxin system HicB family antitoxin [Salmonella enterica]
MKYFIYKGYIGTIEIDTENNFLQGKISRIRDLVIYRVKTIEELEAEFRLSVDIYLHDCEELQRKPDTVFSVEQLVGEISDKNQHELVA